MPKRKAKKAIYNSRRNSSTPAEVTFFNSKLFVALVAIALIIISFAVISSINNNSAEVATENYRIDTTNLKNDPSANQIVP